MQIVPLSILTVLIVHLEPITEILGGPELYINKGSTINLTCVVKYTPEPPPVMLWSHNREVCTPTSIQLIQYMLVQNIPDMGSQVTTLASTQHGVE